MRCDQASPHRHDPPEVGCAPKNDIDEFLSSIEVEMEVIQK